MPTDLIEGGSFGRPYSIKGDKSSQFLSSILLCGPYARRRLRWRSRRPGIEIVCGYDPGDHEGVRGSGKPAGRSIFRVTREGIKAESMLSRETSRAPLIFLLPQPSPEDGLLSKESTVYQAGDQGLLEILERMGCEVHRGALAEIIGGRLQGVDVDMNSMPDAVQRWLLSQPLQRGNADHGRGTSSIQGDRSPRCPEKGTRKDGIETLLEKGVFVVKGGSPAGTEIDTYRITGWPWPLPLRA